MTAQWWSKWKTEPCKWLICSLQKFLCMSTISIMTTYGQHNWDLIPDSVKGFFF
jgi:hypothetical protein